MSQDLNVDQLIEKYCRAKGEDAYAKLHSYQMEGIRVRNDVMPVFFYRTRPNKYMMKFDVGDLTAYRAFDGSSAWHTAPWRGLVEPEQLPAEAAEALADIAFFDDQLANWKAFNHKVKLLDEEVVNGKSQYVLELEHNKTGLTSLYFLDKEKFLLTKIKMVRERGEQMVTNEILYSDYRAVDGILFPFIIEEYTNGYKAVTTEYDEVILNPRLPEDFYSMSRYNTK